MTKKLFIPWLVIAVVTFSTFSVYAATPLMENYEREKELAREKINQELNTAEVTAMTAAEKTLKKAETKIAAEREAERKQKTIEGLAAYIRSVNGNISANKAFGMASAFADAGEQYGVEPSVVMAIAHNESTFYTDAVSCEDFKGLMQTGDGLARNAGYDPSQLFDYRVSINVGSRYLAIKMDEFGDTRLALTAYNQGSGSVHSGNYSTGYAELALSRASVIEGYVNTFLKES